MRINNNISALNTSRQLSVNQAGTARSLERLSSGLRINRAGDDAAGLAISEKMRGQIRGLNQASRNAQDGISLIQTAEGALSEAHSILQRMRELTVQAANDTLVVDDRAAVETEVTQLREELTRIATTTQFNGQTLLDGSLTAFNLQIGANQNQSLQINISDMRAVALGLDETPEIVADPLATPPVVGQPATPGVVLDTHANANASIALIDDAIATVSTQRANFGAWQNRLEHTINNLGASAENLNAAESRIRDVDMAKEMMEFTKNNILSQAAQAMLAQANQLPQGVLQLLR